MLDGRPVLRARGEAAGAVTIGDQREYLAVVASGWRHRGDGAEFSDAKMALFGE